MFLFDRNGDTINIHTMTPREKWIREYRYEEMKKIPRQEQVLKIETNTNQFAFDVNFRTTLVNNPFDINIAALESKHKTITGTKYHRIVPQTNNSSYIADCVTAYANGEYSNSQIARIYEIDEERKKLQFIQYLLLNNYYKKKSSHSKKHTIEDILNIPESLYLLELLYRGKFDQLDNKDISDQLDLFEISDEPIKSYTLSELEAIANFGIAHNAVPNALAKVAKSSNIFERIRKNNR